MVPAGRSATFGYQDWRVTEARHVVRYSGPEVVTTNTQDELVQEAEKAARDTAFDLAAWRAAEIARIYGYPYFTIVKTDSKVGQAIVGHDYRQNGNPVYDNVPGEALGYQTAIYFRPVVTITVELDKEKRDHANNAQTIRQSMAEKYADVTASPIAANTYYYFGPSVVRNRGRGPGAVKVEPPRSGPSLDYAPYAGNKF